MSADANLLYKHKSVAVQQQPDILS